MIEEINLAGSLFSFPFILEGKITRPALEIEGDFRAWGELSDFGDILTG